MGGKVKVDRFICYLLEVIVTKEWQEAVCGEHCKLDGCDATLTTASAEQAEKQVHCDNDDEYITYFASLVGPTLDPQSEMTKRIRISPDSEDG